MSRHWDGLELAVHGKKMIDLVAINGDCLVDELEEDCLELFSVAPFMDLSSKGLGVSADELPQGEVLSWHCVVLCTQLERRAVVSFSITEVNESLLSFG